ncbi:family 43 glycosylhydrolase [Actinophytocola sp.]|uniref:family 43 glycosylhydrolase n=1 Tax=Actinophytocola sp. TaxID=1872138 RepID=UPI00389B3863
MTARVGAALLAIASVLAGCWLAPPAAAEPGTVAAVDDAMPAGRRAEDPVAHDPSVIARGRYFYSFSTGVGLPVTRSTDLLHWEPAGTVFASPPDWVGRELGAVPHDLWAPDISFFDGLYHLYYAGSSFGTNNSVIGLATTPTLDPARWTDRGMVLRTTPADHVNAIDPELFLDVDGTAWLAFGSFWDGIELRRLDRTTGLPSQADPTPYPLASRLGASVEAASILRRGGYYYLFASFDYCCRGVDSDYRLVVGRASRVTGPYLDRDGVPMTAFGGTDLLRGYNEFRGPGHSDTFTAGGADWLVHHYYDLADDGTSKQSVRRVLWRDGWPALSDPLSGSSQVGHGPAWVTVVHRTSGAVLDNPCGYEGSDILLGAPRSGTCQQWRPEGRGDGYASLLNRHSNKVVDVAGCVDADGARVAQWGWVNNDCQKFRLTATADGWSVLENKLSGRVLAPAGCGGAGAAVQTFTRTGQPCQEFRVDPVGDVLIADDAGTGVLQGGCGPAVLMVPRRATPCQLWRFAHTEEGYFQVVNVATGRPLAARRHGPGLTLGEPNDPTPAATWRLEPLGGGRYRLVDRAGRPADSGNSQRFQLLVP